MFQFFFSKSKTLLYNPKNFRSERERFGSITNFVSKTNILDFFLGTLVGKRKQTIFKKRWFDITTGHHDRRRKLAAVHCVPRRRFLAYDREHKASADPYVDELAAFRRQQLHAPESAVPLQAPLVPADLLAAL